MDTSAFGDHNTQTETSSDDWLRLEKNSTTVLRILPQLAGEKTPVPCAKRHFIKINGVNVVFNCASEINQRCAGCEYVDKLLTSANPLDERAAKDASASFYAVARVLDRGKPDAGVKLISFTYSVIKALRALQRGEDGKPGVDVLHPIHGYDIAVTRYTEHPWYEVALANEPSPIARTQEGLEDITRQMRRFNLSDLVSIPEFAVTKSRMNAAMSHTETPPADDTGVDFSSFGNTSSDPF